MRSIPVFASLALFGAMVLTSPARVEVIPGDAKVRITWSPVLGAEGYRIYQGVNGAWSPTPVGRTTRTSFTLDGLANGTRYSFTVAAYTKDGDGPLSLAISAMPLSPPLELKTTAGDRRVTLSWQPSAGATSYTIYRKVGNEPDFRELTTGVTAPPFVDPNLTNGTRYSYQIRAVTAAAESELSVRVSAVPVANTAGRF